MFWLYRLLISTAHGVVYPYARLRAARGNPLWRGRLGLNEGTSVDIWFHAASVGEIKVIGHLIQYLLRLRPSMKFAVTTMTDMGYRTACHDFGDNVHASFFPIDAAPIVRRVLSRLSPKMIVIAETEIWPNLVTEAHKRHIPIVQVNGRLSSRALGRYKLVKKSMHRLLNCYDRLLVKSEDDRRRFESLGVPAGKLITNGDMKFDAPLLSLTSLQMAELRAAAGIADTDFLLVAGSSRPGEETLLLDVYQSIHKAHSSLRLLLAPRHLDRLLEIEALMDARGLRHYRFGTTGPLKEGSTPPDGIVLVDRMGILNDLYAVADIAFVGGTLVNIGGHNILEPVWARTPVVYGPSLDNVREAADYIEQHNFGQRVTDAQELAAVLTDVIQETKTFAVKTDSDIEGSATAAAGDFILERLDSA